MKRYEPTIKGILIAYLCIILTSCAALDMVKKFLPGASEGVSVDAQIGDREGSLAVGGARGAGNIKAEDEATVNVITSSNKAKIESANEVTIHNGPSFWLYALLILGWVLPTPTSMFSSLRKVRLFKRKNKDVK